LYGTGSVAGFFGNRRLTFAHEGSLLGAGARYVIAHCLGYFINLGLLVIMVDQLGYPHQGVQALAILVVAAYLFLALKFFVFANLDLSNARKQ
jgi:putative flippase GtrA